MVPKIDVLSVLVKLRELMVIKGVERWEQSDYNKNVILYCITLIPVKKILTDRVIYRPKGKKVIKKRQHVHSSLEGKLKYQECGERMYSSDLNPVLFACKNGHTRIFPPQEHERKAALI